MEWQKLIDAAVVLLHSYGKALHHLPGIGPSHVQTNYSLVRTDAHQLHVAAPHLPAWKVELQRMVECMVHLEGDRLF